MNDGDEVTPDEREAVERFSDALWLVAEKGRRLDDPDVQTALLEAVRAVARARSE